ncbi:MULTISPECIES: type II toxin-antitoxin system RelE/ParE family toxin [Pseudomonas]|uniref:type II toxin-antitoxin system RelE/ParE family toxin n=1 Tax=Pseudomonas TaxID=286 RepID=UPI002B411181|nr:type II toxin-antitoxin system RelE/ParE family toxin [Pseudomonas sichuanensis]
MKYLLSVRFLAEQDYLVKKTNIHLREYSLGGILLAWSISFCVEFAAEFETLDRAVKKELMGQLRFLEHQGPEVGRPKVDTLKGSRHRNMKELRFRVGRGAWRIAFAFDPARCAVMLVAGDKAGLNERLFYQRLLTRADDRFDNYLLERENNDQDTR